MTRSASGKINLEAALQAQGKTLDKHGSEIDVMRWVVLGVVVVLFIGFAGMLVALGAMLQAHYVEKAATYQNLVNQINQLQNKIDQTYQKCEIQQSTSSMTPTVFTQPQPK